MKRCLSKSMYSPSVLTRIAERRLVLSPNISGPGGAQSKLSEPPAVAGGPSFEGGMFLSILITHYSSPFTAFVPLRSNELFGCDVIA